MPVYVAYASRRGATAEIAEMIAAESTDAGRDVRCQPIGADLRFDDAAPVVLGSGIYAGRWLKVAQDLMRRHPGLLSHRLGTPEQRRNP